ncbi:MAG: LysR family transcriptional regulator [Opitutae bacterium]|nr:LysR family transcriptional regulator [Opitutae bacterium]
MHLDDLRIFRAVVQAGGVTRAAARLQRAPSNVTTRIQQLEANLGVPLFTRERKRLQLSPQGHLLLAYAERLLHLAAEARDALHDSAPRGVFHLGAMDSAAATRLPGPLAEYHRRHPQTSIELVTGPTLRLVKQVLARSLEAAVVANPPAEDRLEALPLVTEELVLIAAAGHPPIRTPQDVAYHNFLTFGSGCAYRQRLEDWFARAGKVPARISEFGSYHAILGCVAAGMGLALVPKIILDQFPARAALSLHPLPARMARIKLCLVWRRHESSPRLLAFRAILTGKKIPAAARAAGTPPVATAFSARPSARPGKVSSDR